MIRKRIPEGTVVHLQGLPFRLAYDTIIEGHEANFGLLRPREQEAAEAVRRAVEYVNRPWWKRLLGIR